MKKVLLSALLFVFIFLESSELLAHEDSTTHCAMYVSFSNETRPFRGAGLCLGEFGFEYSSWNRDKDEEEDISYFMLFPIQIQNSIGFIPRIGATNTEGNDYKAEVGIIGTVNIDGFLIGIGMDTRGVFALSVGYQWNIETGKRLRK